jgi:hypothetical protein
VQGSQKGRCRMGIYVCYYHPERQSAAVCIRCQNFICKECQNLIEGQIYCISCANIVRGIDAAEKGSEVKKVMTTKRMINIIREGKAEIKLLGAESPVTLDDEEKLKLVLPNISLLEPRAVRTGGAVYGGPTIHVAKGVSFRLGAAGGRATSHDEIQTIDTGILSLTNTRIIFAGRMRNVDIPLRQVESVEPYKSLLSEGIGIRKQGAMRMQYFAGSKTSFSSIKLELTYEDDRFEENFSGELLEALVEGECTQYRKLVSSRKEAADTKAGESIIKQIEELGKLKDKGIITKDEFEIKKAELLRRL